MGKASRLSTIVTLGFLATFLSGFVAAWAMGEGDVVIDKQTEMACFQEIKNRTPLGSRDIKTISYRIEGTNVGVAKGDLLTRTPYEGWTKISWHCRVGQKNGRVVRMEFGRLVGNSRLLAAAAAF